MIGAALIAFGLGLALLVAWWWRPRKQAEPSSWLLLVAYGLLGAWTLCFGLFLGEQHEPPGLMFWKPTIVWWTLSGILLTAPALRLGYPIKVILGVSFAWTGGEWRLLNLAFAVLFAVVGAVNLLVAFTRPHEDWTGFKFSCLVLMLFIFLFRLNFVWTETARRVVVYLVGRAKAWLP